MQTELRSGDEVDRVVRERSRTFVDAVWLALVPGAVWFAVLQVRAALETRQVGVDSHAYWLAARFPETWYSRPPGSTDAFLYSPLVGQLLRPLGALPWPAFQSLWAIGEVVVLALLLAPLGWRRALTIAPLFVTEVLLGNVYVLMAGALVLGLAAAPEALAFLLLTKVTSGVAGLWCVVRGQWVSAARCLLCTAVLVGVSVWSAPEAWADWLRFLQEHAGGHTFARVAAAAVLTIWAARTGRAWVVAPAVLLACPVTHGFAPFALLAAIPRLRLLERRADPAGGDRSGPILGA